MVRQDGHHDAVKRVMSAVRLEAERRVRSSKSVGERILGAIHTRVRIFELEESVFQSLHPPLPFEESGWGVFEVEGRRTYGS